MWSYEVVPELQRYSEEALKPRLAGRSQAWTWLVLGWLEH
jgi:hypothetical protein